MSLTYNYFDIGGCNCSGGGGGIQCLPITCFLPATNLTLTGPPGTYTLVLGGGPPWTVGFQHVPPVWFQATMQCNTMGWQLIIDEYTSNTIGSFAGGFSANVSPGYTCSPLSMSFAISTLNAVLNGTWTVSP